MAGILDGIALESPPGKKCGDHCVRQLSPKKAAGMTGAVLGTRRSPHGAFQSWTPGPYHLK